MQLFRNIYGTIRILIVIFQMKELRLKMAVAPSKPEEDEDEDELEKIRRRRLQALKFSTQGRIHEIQDKDKFLQILDESSSDGVIIIHIYRDGLEACESFDEILKATSGRCSGDIQFYKVQASVLDTTKKFVGLLIKIIYHYVDISG